MLKYKTFSPQCTIDKFSHIYIINPLHSIHVLALTNSNSNIGVTIIPRKLPIAELKIAAAYNDVTNNIIMMLIRAKGKGTCTIFKKYH